MADPTVEAYSSHDNPVKGVLCRCFFVCRPRISPVWKKVSNTVRIYRNGFSVAMEPGLLLASYTVDVCLLLKSLLSGDINVSVLP